MAESDFDQMDQDSVNRIFEEEYEDEYEEQEPDYYYCSCCNHLQAHPGMGFGCDRCGLFNVMEEGYF